MHSRLRPTHYSIVAESCERLKRADDPHRWGGHCSSTERFAGHISVCLGWSSIIILMFILVQCTTIDEFGIVRSNEENRTPAELTDERKANDGT